MDKELRKEEKKGWVNKYIWLLSIFLLVILSASLSWAAESLFPISPLLLL